jgi:hypothetical protein
MGDVERYQQITPHLWLTQIDGTIIDTLSEHNALPANWHEDQLISFFANGALYLAFYFSKSDDKGFLMFIVHDFANQVDDLTILSRTLSEVIARGQTNEMFLKAMQQIDSLITMSNLLHASEVD